MKKIINLLSNSLQDVRKKAQSADEQLNKIKKEQTLGFTQILNKESGFSCQEKNFTPYVAELEIDFKEYQKTPSEQQLHKLLQKIQILLSTINLFLEKLIVESKNN